MSVKMFSKISYKNIKNRVLTRIQSRLYYSPLSEWEALNRVRTLLTTLRYILLWSVGTCYFAKIICLIMSNHFQKKRSHKRTRKLLLKFKFFSSGSFKFVYCSVYQDERKRVQKRFISVTSYLPMS